MTDNSQVIKLGEHIFLEGFSSIDSASMIIMKKLIGNHAKNISDKISDFNLTLKLKDDYDAKLTFESKGKSTNYSDSDKNMFICVDKVFKKIQY